MILSHLGEFASVFTNWARGKTFRQIREQAEGACPSQPVDRLWDVLQHDERLACVDDAGGTGAVAVLGEVVRYSPAARAVPTVAHAGSVVISVVRFWNLSMPWAENSVPIS
jgi:hypothetical protein